MSRLQRHYKKRLYLYIALIIIAAIFLSTTGLQFVINSSSFLSNLLGKRDASDRRNPLLQTIVLDEIPTATNSASIIISGNANNLDRVEFYLNSDKVEETTINDSGDFEEELTGLKEGENEIYVIGKSSKGKKQSDIYTVVYKQNKPTLEIREPSDGSVVKQEDIKLSGHTDSEVEVKVNDLPVVVDSSGNFQTTVRLREGENKIKVAATDIAGNTENKELTIKYEK